MKKKEGKWYVLSRGTNPRPWDNWKEECYSEDFPQALHDFMQWAWQGQHVRLEFIPDGTYGSFSPEHDRS